MGIWNWLFGRQEAKPYPTTQRVDTGKRDPSPRPQHSASSQSPASMEEDAYMLLAGKQASREPASAPAFIGHPPPAPEMQTQTQDLRKTGDQDHSDA